MRLLKTFHTNTVQEIMITLLAELSEVLSGTEFLGMPESYCVVARAVLPVVIPAAARPN